MRSTTIFLALVACNLLAHVPALQFLVSQVSQYGYALLHPSYKKFINENLGTCFMKCIDDEDCSSINYNLNNGDCEQSHMTKRGFPSLFVARDNFIYGETRQPVYGSSKYVAVQSCKRILELHPKAISGVYWIRLENGNSQNLPFQVYCDMHTDGGGWTLVYSYRFLNFGGFNSGSNGLHPIPSFPVEARYLDSGVSTTVPLNETAYAAMNFTLWKEIGQEFLIKPNITHWISCVPETGDLVNWKEGSVTCKVIKNVATACLNKVPTTLRKHPCGIALFASNFYLFFEGEKTRCYPVHDPCGTSSASNHLTKVDHPGGVVYIR